MAREDDKALRQEIIGILNQKEGVTIAVVEMSKRGECDWAGKNYETATHYYLLKLIEKITENKEAIPLGVLKSLFDVRVIHKEGDKWVNNDYPFLYDLRKYIEGMMEEYI